MFIHENKLLSVEVSVLLEYIYCELALNNYINKCNETPAINALIRV